MTLKNIVSITPKYDLIIALLYLGKLSLWTHTNCSLNNKNWKSGMPSKCYFKVEIWEHLEFLTLTGKTIKGEDLLFCNHFPDFEDFLFLLITTTKLR